LITWTLISKIYHFFHLLFLSHFCLCQTRMKATSLIRCITLSLYCGLWWISYGRLSNLYGWNEWISGTCFAHNQDNSVRFMLSAVRLGAPMRTRSHIVIVLSGYEPKAQSDWDLEDHSRGCMRKTRLQCDRVSIALMEVKDRFHAISNMRKKK